VSLFDITLNQSVFAFHHHMFTESPYFPTWSGIDSLTLEPLLFASHVYSLTTEVRSFANGDGWSSSITVSGLQPVAAIPEPRPTRS